MPSCPRRAVIPTAEEREDGLKNVPAIGSEMRSGNCKKMSTNRGSYSHSEIATDLQGTQFNWTPVVHQQKIRRKNTQNRAAWTQE